MKYLQHFWYHTQIIKDCTTSLPIAHNHIQSRLRAVGDIIDLIMTACTDIIALKASGRDCTNNNELLHKIGVLQRNAMQLFVFTRKLLLSIRWRSKYNGCTQII